MKRAEALKLWRALRRRPKTGKRGEKTVKIYKKL
jgi:hypothetical protein